MGSFTRALREAQILDNRAIDSTGAAVVLPYGVELFNRFRSLVHTAYRSAGLAEYEYPSLVPVAATELASRVVELHDRVLLVGTASELARNEPPLALTPTGETVIYGHWSQMINARGDLPVRMYRRARYFRPVSRGRHAGRGIFHSAEHDDVFEFHCAHEDLSTQQDDLRHLQQVLHDLINSVHVPVLWSTRPPWTNRAEVAEAAIGADAPLPLRLTAQIACLYDQRTRFSRPYQIGFRENGVFQCTQQVAGYVSRRLLMAHLMFGLQQRGRLSLHPDVAPVQVLMLVRLASDEVHADLAQLTEQLHGHGLLVREIRCDTPVALSRAQREWASRGVPVTIQAFAPRNATEQRKFVLGRADTDQEQVIRLDRPSDLIDEAVALVADIAEGYEAATWDFARGRLRSADLNDLPEVLDERLVAVSPLAASETAARGIGALGKGEVLGYCRVQRAQPCILTGEVVDTVAFISPRL